MDLSEVLQQVEKYLTLPPRIEELLARAETVIADIERVIADLAGKPALTTDTSAQQAPVAVTPATGAQQAPVAVTPATSATSEPVADTTAAETPGAGQMPWSPQAS